MVKYRRRGGFGIPLLRNRADEVWGSQGVGLKSDGKTPRKGMNQWVAYVLNHWNEGNETWAQALKRLAPQFGAQQGRMQGVNAIRKRQVARQKIYQSIPKWARLDAWPNRYVYGTRIPRNKMNQLEKLRSRALTIAKNKFLGSVNRPPVRVLGINRPKYRIGRRKNNINVRQAVERPRARTNRPPPVLSLPYNPIISNILTQSRSSRSSRNKTPVYR